MAEAPPATPDAESGPEATGRSSLGGYEVDLDAYSGPLELLLSLIRREQIDIFDIPIARITDQYLAALAQMQENQVEVSGEFIVLAATLMQIKSRMLLPKPTPENPEDEDEEDPRTELVELILDYQRYREAAEMLETLAELRQRLFDVPGQQVDTGPRALRSTPMTALLGAYARMLERATKEEAVRQHRLLDRPYTVAEQSALILRRLAQGPVRFLELFSPSPSRLELVVTLMALLELVRDDRLRAEQDGPFGDIWIRRLEPSTAQPESA